MASTILFLKRWFLKKSVLHSNIKVTIMTNLKNNYVF